MPTITLINKLRARVAVMLRTRHTKDKGSSPKPREDDNPLRLNNDDVPTVQF